MSATRIHIADDDADDRLFLEEAIREISPAALVSASVSGDDLIQHLHQYVATNSLPNVVVLDLNMPGRDGLSCLAEIKATPHLREIPVVVLATVLDETTVAACYARSATRCVAKPDSIEAMRRIAASLLESATATPAGNRTN